MIRKTLPMLWALLAVAGCGDDLPGPGGDGGWTMVVQVRDLADQSPVQGVKAILMDPATNRALSPPQLSSSRGSWDFGRAPVWDAIGRGAVQLQVYGGTRWRVSSMTRNYWAKEAGRPLAPAAAGTKLAPEIPPPTVWLERTVPPPGARVQGRVVDANTGLPLEAAFITDYPDASGYVGRNGAGEDVTGADGTFDVAGILFFVPPGGDTPEQLIPLYVTREGYRPRVWRHVVQGGGNADDVPDAVIALEPRTAGDTGVLSGRLLRLDRPVAAARVALSVAEITGGAAAAKRGPGLVDRLAVSDSAGCFRFPDLAAGAYLVHPGHLPGDGVYFPVPEFGLAYAVVPGAETDVGDLAVYHEISLQEPIGPDLYGDWRFFAWSPVPDIGVYLLYLDDYPAMTATDNWLEWPAEIPLDPGTHSWRVVGVDELGRMVAAPERPAEFHLPFPED